jgi:sugar lactone lactonase YvrE
VPNRTSGVVSDSSVHLSPACCSNARVRGHGPADQRGAGTTIPRPARASQRLPTGGNHHRSADDGVRGFTCERRHLCSEPAYGRAHADQRGSGTPSVGLKIDNRGQLFVAGGPDGTGRVIAVKTGEILEDYVFTTAPSFVNDVVLTRDYAWFTDSQQPQLYGVPLGRGGAPGEPADVVTLPLTGDWQQVTGFNANGIAETPDRQALLVVNSMTGLLYRVDPETGEATQVDLGGTLLTGGDGLLVLGETLYVVQNQLNRVAVITLDANGTSGELRDVLTSEGFDVPTTVAAFGNSLYLPNARFTTPPTPDTPYWVTRIDRR